MPDATTKTVLFLFGQRPAEPALLQAQSLCGMLQEQKWQVDIAAVASSAASLLRKRFDRPTRVVLAPLAGLPLVGPLFRPTVVPAVVHAWDLQAAAAARRVFSRSTRLCLTLSSMYGSARLTAAARTLRSVDCVICHSESLAGALGETGIEPCRVALLPPAIDKALLDRAGSHRDQVRAVLSHDDPPGPLVVTPPPVQSGSGHYEAAWATFILRRAGVTARLVLPYAGRESSRIVRFSRACKDELAVTIAPTDLTWLDLLSAADLIVLPDHAQADAAIAASALACGCTVIIRTSDPAAAASPDRVISSPACLFTVDPRPLSLARTLLRAWTDRQATSTQTKAPAQVSSTRSAAVSEYLKVYTARP